MIFCGGKGCQFLYSLKKICALWNLAGRLFPSHISGKHLEDWIIGCFIFPEQMANSKPLRLSVIVILIKALLQLSHETGRTVCAVLGSFTESVFICYSCHIPRSFWNIVLLAWRCSFFLFFFICVCGRMPTLWEQYHSIMESGKQLNTMFLQDSFIRKYTTVL